MASVAPNGGYSYAPVAESWNGTTWAPAPIEAGALGGRLAAISCVSATFCVAVGADSAEEPLAAFWDGTRWTSEAAAGLGRDGSLSGVACASASACTAVGAYDYGPGPELDVGIVAERWNGSRWTSQPAPGIKGWVYSKLASVACPTVSECVAVGDASQEQIESRTLVELWTGARWRVLASPNGPGLQPGLGLHSPLVGSVLTGVSCRSASSCIAVGVSDDYEHFSGQNLTATERTLVESWDGRRWTRQASPSRAHGSALVSVSCVAPSTCVAVGGEDSQNLEQSTPLVESLGNLASSPPPLL